MNLKLSDWKKAGNLSYRLLKYGEKKAKDISSVLELARQMEEKLNKMESDASLGFPINISFDNSAAHDAPSYNDDRELQGIVKLDVGVDYNGAIGDNALTIDLTDQDHSDLIDASYNSLENACDVLKEGNFSIDDISRKIESTMDEFGINPVSNLTGHGLDVGVIHKDPKIPNVYSEMNQDLKNNSFFAIEPFASYGSGSVREKGNPEIFALKRYKPLRGRFSKKVAKFVKDNYDKKPFSKRWLVEKFGKGKVNLAFKRMKNKDMLVEYPPLVDDGLVSQFEYSFGIIDDEVVRLTK